VLLTYSESILLVDKEHDSCSKAESRSEHCSAGNNLAFFDFDFVTSSVDLVSSLFLTSSHFLGPLIEFVSDLVLVAPVLSEGERVVGDSVGLHGGVAGCQVRHVTLNLLGVLLKDDFFFEVLVQVVGGFTKLAFVGSDCASEADVVNETVLTDQLAETNTSSVRDDFDFLLGGHEHN